MLIEQIKTFDCQNNRNLCVCSLKLNVCRRNSPGDREQALKVMLQVLPSCEHPAPDMFCLCGRIYKDIFLDSDCKDTINRDNAIQWWEYTFSFLFCFFSVFCFHSFLLFAFVSCSYFNLFCPTAQHIVQSWRPLVLDRCYCYNRGLWIGVLYLYKPLCIWGLT